MFVRTVVNVDHRTNTYRRFVSRAVELHIPGKQLSAIAQTRDARAANVSNTYAH